MSRSLWFVAGAGAGVYAVSRARRAAEALTIEGLRDRLGAVATGARLFRDEVVAGRDEKEAELRERLHLVPRGVPALEGRPVGLGTLAGGRHPTPEQDPRQESSS